MTLENKCTITTSPNGTIKIEVTSTGHPLDEVIALMLKGLQKSEPLKKE